MTQTIQPLTELELKTLDEKFGSNFEAVKINAIARVIQRLEKENIQANDNLTIMIGVDYNLFKHYNYNPYFSHICHYANFFMAGKILNLKDELSDVYSVALRFFPNTVFKNFDCQPKYNKDNLITYLAHYFLKDDKALNVSTIYHELDKLKAFEEKENLDSLIQDKTNQNTKMKL